MTWIRTIPFEEADDKLKILMMMTRALYPKEYANPVSPGGESIVSSHTLIPDALYHIFAGYAAMLSPDLPLRRDQHEMIATIVSLRNSCYY